MATLTAAATITTLPAHSHLSPAASLHHLRPLHFRRRFSRLTAPPLRLATRCSADDGGGEAFPYRRSHSPPPTIPWKKEFANTVHLIGTVGGPVQIKQLASGKAFAWTKLSVWKSPIDSTWIGLSLWDDLAHTAFQYVEEGQRIYVRGRLVSDVAKGDVDKKQYYYNIIVQELNFIEKGVQSVPLYNENSRQYNSDATMTGSRMGSHPGDNQDCSVEQLWQAFFANPLEWWDNRNNKRTPKYPDFKHKDTGEALWIENRNCPPWVKSQLAILDSRMGSMRMNETGRRLSVMPIDEITNF